VSFIDTRRDEEREQRKLTLSPDDGEIVALAFAPRSDALVGVTGGKKPILFEVQPQGDPPTWPLNQSALVRKTEVPPTEPGLRRAPTSVAVMLRTEGSDDELKYVLYESPRLRAATIHSGPSLAEIGRVDSNVAGRSGPVFGAGDFVTTLVPDSVLRTSVTGARDIVFDPTNLRAWALFGRTGNVGLLRLNGGYFDEVAATTRATGGFFLPRTKATTTINASPELQPGGAGVATTVSVSTTPDLTDQRVYDPVIYPSSLATDQQGALLAAHFVGGVAPDLRDPLRIYSASRLADAFGAMAIRELSPTTTGLDEPFLGPRAFQEYILGVAAARDLAFGPQVSVLAPAPGSVQRGVVAVHLAVRDPSVRRISCQVVDRPTEKIYSFPHAGASLSPLERDLGIVVNPTSILSLDLGTRSMALGEPCVFNSLPTGQFLLRIHVETTTQDTWSMNVPFEYREF
jgi:hypothetical protein